MMETDSTKNCTSYCPAHKWLRPICLSVPFYSTTDGSLPDEGGVIEEDNSTVNRMLSDKELIRDGLHVGGTTVKMESELSNIETTEWLNSKVFTETDDESSQTRKTVLYACKTQVLGLFVYISIILANRNGTGL